MTLYSFLRKYLSQNTTTLLVALVYCMLILLIIYTLVMLGPGDDLRYLNY